MGESGLVPCEEYSTLNIPALTVSKNHASSPLEASSCPSEGETDTEGAPRRGTPRFDEVVAAGCQGVWTDLHDWGREFDCDSDYTWTCDECPVNEAQREADDLEDE